MSRASKCQVRHNWPMSNRVETIADAIAATLKAKGLSMRGVSLSAGLSESAIKHITRGTSDSPRLETLAKICAAMSAPFTIGIGHYIFSAGYKTNNSGMREATIVPSCSPNDIAQNDDERRLLDAWRSISEEDRGALKIALRNAVRAQDSDAA